MTDLSEFNRKVDDLYSDYVLRQNNPVNNQISELLEKELRKSGFNELEELIQQNDQDVKDRITSKVISSSESLFKWYFLHFKEMVRKVTRNKSELDHQVYMQIERLKETSMQGYIDRATRKWPDLKYQLCEAYDVCFDEFISQFHSEFNLEVDSNYVTRQEFNNISKQVALLHHSGILKYLENRYTSLKNKTYLAEFIGALLNEDRKETIRKAIVALETKKGKSPLSADSTLNKLEILFSDLNMKIAENP